jgi:hypothetical protein
VSVLRLRERGGAKFSAKTVLYEDTVAVTGVLVA